MSYSWELIEESFSLLDSTLNLEDKISIHYLEDTKFRMSAKNGKILAAYTTEFIPDYNAILNGMVERRLQRAILVVGSF